MMPHYFFYQLVLFGPLWLFVMLYYARPSRCVATSQRPARHTADYAPDLVTQTQAARALQRTQDFLAAIRQRGRTYESGTT